jgi:uncharacterized protein YeaO (DUF488 family)
MLTIKTGRVGKDSGLDITVKSGSGFGRELAPTWELVAGHKRMTAETTGKRVEKWMVEHPALSDDEYTERYLNLLRERYAKHRALWNGYLRAHESITLLCYCRDGVFCHRHIAREVLIKVAEHIGIEVGP